GTYLSEPRTHPDLPAATHRGCHVSLPKSSSSSRFTAGAPGFFDLIQSRERPERLGRAKALAHDPLEAEPAGVAENDIAALDDVFISIARPRRLYGPAWQ